MCRNTKIKHTFAVFVLIRTLSKRVYGIVD